MVWGLTGRWRDAVSGVVCSSGYFPLAGEIEGLRMLKKEKEKEEEGGAEAGDKGVEGEGEGEEKKKCGF